MDCQWNQARVFTKALIFFWALMLPWTGRPVIAASQNPAKAPVVDEATKRRAIQMLQSGPAVFIENRGQWDDPIQFALSGAGVNVGLAESALRFQLLKREPVAGQVAGPQLPTPKMPLLPGRHDQTSFTTRMHEFTSKLAGARPTKPVGKTKSAQLFHYRKGDRSHWRENVGSWETVTYPGIYEGVDLVISGRKGGLKYDFNLAPGADWKQIRFQYEGISGLKVREDGALEITPAPGWAPLVDGAPVIYQEQGGQRTVVAGRFRLIDERTLGFEVTGAYDRTRPLVIDPALSWATYAGADGAETGAAIAVNEGGEVYIAGSTTSNGWVAGAGSDTYLGGTHDAYVVRLTSTGNIIWSGYLGGGDDDVATGVAASDFGEVYIVGYTASLGWTTGGYQVNFAGGNYDGFVVKMNNQGEFSWSTYVGGIDADYIRCAAIDSSGGVAVGGETQSDMNWPKNGGDTTWNGGGDGFVSVLGSEGGESASTYLGGSNADSCERIAVSSDGSILATGWTNSPGWITGGYNTTRQALDGFLVKLDGGLNKVWGTYLGGAGDDAAYAVCVDNTGKIYVTGYTQSPTGWISGGADTIFGGGRDAFLVKVSDAGAHLWSSYLGGTLNDTGYGLGVFNGTSTKSIYVSGSTGSGGWTSGGWDTSFNSGEDTFLAKFSESGQALWSSYLGGAGNDQNTGLAMRSATNIYLVGTTNSDNSSNWVSGGFDTSYNGGNDAYVAMVRDDGAVQVFIDPPAAAGSQWRIKGQSTWVNSGYIWAGLTGPQDLEILPASGWNAPVPPITGIPTVAGDVTVVTATLTRQTGSLKVNIMPSAAVSAGAQWRRQGTTTWMDSGATEPAVPVGPVTVEFKAVTDVNWTPSLPKDVTIYNGATATLSGTYVAPVCQLSWSSYSGGAEEDEALDMAIDASGNLYVAGTTKSSGWISGGYDTDFGGTAPYDGFVIKLAPAGSQLWSTYIGSEGDDSVNGIVVDHAGNIVLTGDTTSADWANGGDSDSLNGGVDAFVLKLTPAGQHSWSSYLGGSGNDSGKAVAVDSANNIYVAGSTAAGGWLVGGMIDTTYNGGASDAIIAKYTSAGALAWVNCLGGSGADAANGVTVDSADSVILAGQTNSTGWISGIAQPDYQGGPWDGFVYKISPAGTFAWSSYLGGSGDDRANSVAASGTNIFVCGRTESPVWLNGGYDRSYNGLGDGFVLRMSAGGSMGWGTYVGGAQLDVCDDVTVSPWGDVGVTGYSQSECWVSAGFNAELSGPSNAFTLLLSGTGEHQLSALLGGGGDAGSGTVFDASGALYVCGTTPTPDWTTGPDKVFKGQTDTFVAKVQPLGGVTATIMPPAAVTAGALWRRQGTTTWLNSGAIESNLPVGLYNIEYKKLTGWFEPQPQAVRVAVGVTTTTVGTYAQGGDLKVTITPAGAVTDGAQWRRVGTTTWLNSGVTETNIPALQYTIEFKPIAGYTTPGSAVVNMVAGQLTQASGTYVRLVGGLQINIEPAAARTGGAQWKRQGTSIWLDSGQTETNIPTGTYNIDFKPVTDWNAPTNLSVLVNALVTTSVQATYTRQTGSLTVTIDPPAAAAEGAQWKRQGTSTWLDSGATETGIPTGNVVVEFKAIANWAGPANQSITILNNQTSTMNGSYIRDTGQLQVTITPPAAVAAGAQWRRAGTTTWLNSGATESGVPTGNQIIEFKNVTGWGANSSQSVTVIKDQLTTAQGTYVPMGTLTVTVNPAEAATAGGQWRRQGTTAWLDSGATEWVPVSSYTVEFKSLFGWTTPADASVSVAQGQTVSASGTYVRQTGSLKVTLFPNNAVTSGAQWRRLGTVPWQNSGATESAVPVDNYTVEFKEISGWVTPRPIDLVVNDGQLTQTSGTYISSNCILLWSTYAGGTGLDLANAAAIDGSDNIYVTGSTQSAGWVSGGPDPAHKGDADVFVMKLAPDGQMVWSTYLGGAQADNGSAIAVDAAGSIYVAGDTASTTSWLTGGYHNSYGGGMSDGFAVKLSAAGAPVWGTYLGGTDVDNAYGIGVDGTGAVYVCGETASMGWTSGGWSTVYNTGSRDGFLVKLSGSGTHTWSSYVGGAGTDSVRGLGIDQANNIYLGGYTSWGQWASGGFDTSYNGGFDGFVVKASAAGTHLWSTYLGGSVEDFVMGLGVDAAGYVAVGGTTKSAGWVSGGFDTTHNGYEDAFAARLTPAGQLQWSTYLGGDVYDYVNGVAVDSKGGVYLTGKTYSAGWTSGGYNTKYLYDDAYAARVTPTGQLAWSTYIGGGISDTGLGVAVGGSQKVVVVGSTSSTGWTVGGFDTTYNGSQDAFVARIQNLSGLRVDLEPPAVIPMGAQWRRLGTSAWRDSGTTETLLPGNYTLEFKAVTGYSSPANTAVTVSEVEVTTVSGRYVRQTGGLKVTVAPAQAAAEGAQWRRVGTTPWLNSGATETGLPTGNYDIEFNSIPNWTSPDSQTVTVDYNQVTSATGTFVRHSGSLQVTITPAAAVADGARWRRLGTSNWLNSGDTEAGVPTGNHTIEFKNVPQWFTPANQSVTILRNQTATASANYLRMGNLSVDIAPPGAVSAGAKWRRVGTTAWLDSGAVETGLAVGAYQVEFKDDLADWAAPAATPVTVLEDQTVTAVGTYARATGLLRVTLTPPAAAAAGAAWHRVGSTAWLSSGTSESVVTGNYTLEFKSLDGWSTPEAVNVTVTRNQVTQASADYSAIQETLLWSTYLGGSGQDIGYDVTVDWAGNIYVAGETKSSGWISGGFDPTPNGDSDAFVMMLSPGGTPQWSTYLGGSKLDIAYGVSVDLSRNVFVTGETASDTAWFSGGSQMTYGGGGNDTFVVKLTSAGQMVWGTYVGGSGYDYGLSIATNNAGEAYLCGLTSSQSGLVSGGWSAVYNGGSLDGYVVKLSGAGTHLWSSYVGGGGTDSANKLALDSSGNVCIVGYTSWGQWASGGYNTTHSGNLDGFVVKADKDGKHVWSTYLGGSENDNAQGVGVDSMGNVYATGMTASTGWISGGYDTTLDGANDGFLIKLTPGGQPLWSTYLGGAATDNGEDVAVDDMDSAYVIGNTNSAGWVSGGLDTTYAWDDAFLAKVSKDGRPMWSTYIGGGDREDGYGVAVDSDRKVVVTGYTNTANWAMGGYDLVYDGGTDAFVARIQNLGQMRVDIAPPGAMTDGAKWRIVGTTVWYDGGTTVSTLWPGSYNVEFLPIQGWTTPSNQSLIVYNSQIATGVGTYVRHLGSLQVTVNPAGAVTGGAQWRRVGTTTWFNSGAVEANVPTGNYQIEFKTIPLYTSPANLPVTVLQNQTAIVAADYVRQTGSLKMTLTPAGALAVGAQWRRVGTGAWLDSDATDSGIPTGNVDVEFKPVSGYTAPPNQLLTINFNQLTTGTALYDINDGVLQVDISPAEAVAAGAQWRRVGTTTWHNSGDQETDLPIAVTAVEFKHAPYWTPPLNMSVALKHGELGLIAATYTPSACDLAWSTYLGGANDEACKAVAADAAGNVVAAGWTQSSGWISGSSLSGATDAFVIKLSPAGQPVWEAYLGGAGTDSASGVALDGSGNVYATGLTGSSGWLSGGYDATLGGTFDTFLIKLASTGQTQWGTYVGGSSLEWDGGVAVDPSGNVVLTGSTSSSDLATGGADVTYGGGATDAFVAKVGPAGQLLWSSYLGGSQGDRGHAVATDGLGNIYVTGDTNSAGWMTGSPSTSPAGGFDAFVSKLTPAGQITWSTYVGGLTDDYGYGIAVSLSGIPCVAGYTNSDGWTRGGFDTSLNGKNDGFVAQLSATGREIWSTYLGGSGDDFCYGVAMDGANNIFVTGSSEASTWALGGYDLIHNGGKDAFLAKLSPLGQHQWSSYLGGAGDEDGIGIAAPAGRSEVFIGGQTASAGWPAGGYDTTLGGTKDGFAAKFTHRDAQLNGTLSVTITPSSMTALGAQWRRAGTSAWKNSGDSENLPVGYYSIEFKPVSQWVTPDTVDVKVDAGQTASVTGVYMTQALRVTLLPKQAVLLGAKWRRVGTTAWIESGMLEADPPGTSAVVEFLDAAGYDRPANVPVTLTRGEVTSITASYTLKPGTLKVTILPAEVVTAGAMWRRVGTTVWLASGATEANVPAGPHTIEFKPVAGWTEPTPQLFDVITNQANFLTISYVRQTGSLLANLSPQGAIADGAMWRRVGSSQWNMTGCTETKIPIGSYTVEFRDVPGWTKPANQAVTISMNQTVTISAGYTRQTGGLKVTIGPSYAVSAGARWRRAGTTTWLASGATENNIPTGDVTVEFKDLPGTNWLQPGKQTVSVQAGKVASMGASYAPKLNVTAASPQSQSVMPGQSASFTVSASGATPFSYQWMRNGVAISPGGRSATLSLAACQLSDEGTYVCEVSNAYAKVTSPEFKLVVNNAGDIIAYLLGKRTSTPAMDLNKDKKIDVADALWGVRNTPPSVPSAPTPASGMTGLGLRPHLDWADCTRADSYEVYVWPASQPLPGIPTASGLKVSQFDVPTSLSHYTTYNWQVVARRGDLKTVASRGPVWYFITEQAVRMLIPYTDVTWKRGDTVNVRWKAHVPTAGTTMRLELWKGVTKVATLKEASTSSTGLKNEMVTIPTTVAPGTGYRVRVISPKLEAAYMGNVAWDDSDGMVTIN